MIYGFKEMFKDNNSYVIYNIYNDWADWIVYGIKIYICYIPTLIIKHNKKYLSI